ncbi:glycosyltransferase family 2 protein [Aureimonas frigidaquae]|uniref:glycosyltransferase family 2 protein n=1 Tax=Aureimonas frigidaquae TaxID=424757 RepID=UPI000781856A|nr:glycosyltransferase family 2 protein [Aureimonas frigidaquae]
MESVRVDKAERETEIGEITCSLIIPVYRNEENIEDLLAVLAAMNEEIENFEVVFVVDGSPDESGALLAQAYSQLPFHATIAYHSRNFGSFTAIRTGLELARGKYIAVMAADLQEPPELITNFFAVLEANEADIVFGERTGRHDHPVRDWFSDMFWATYRRMVIRDVPKGGVDIFACNRMAVDAVLQIEEPNSSLIAQLFWVGFRRKFIPYERQERLKGKSAWNFSRRMRYMMDSIFSFSDLPILLVLWFGVIGCLLSLLFGMFILLSRLLGFITEPGYASLMLFIAFTSSATLAVQGVMGSYLWRTFENTKRRPLRIVSRVISSGPAQLVIPADTRR